LPKYQVSFIVEQLYYQDVEADSPEDALEKYHENPNAVEGEWSSVQEYSYYVDEIK